jgi:hypothetical protein
MVSPAIDTSDMVRGPSAAFTVAHAEAGSYVYGFRSIVSTTGFGGKYCNVAGANPGGSLKGGSIRALMKRYASGGDYAPMIGVLNSTDPTTGEGYLLGLSAGTTYQVVLKKGTPASGLDPSSSSVLRASTASYTGVGDGAAVWFHLRLDVLVNPHGEVVLDVYSNDVANEGVDSPTWEAITGMDQYIDDSFGVLSGSNPIVDPLYFIFGVYSEDAGSIAMFDHIQITRQTAP